MTIKFLILFSIFLLPQISAACSVCYGVSADSPIAQGMNMAIITLLAVTGSVLCSFVGFIYYLRKRTKQNSQ